MSAAGFALLAVAIVLGTAGQILLKAGASAVGAFPYTLEAAPAALAKLALEPRILGGAACYAASLVMWIAALTRVEVSVAYPMVSLGFALNALLAWWLLGEAVTPLRLAGIGVIVVGVAMVARS